MASRRDQLQSYQFMVHRVISALVMRETDPAESPLRRGVGAMFGGFMIFIIVAAGFGVFGLITHIGDQKWRVDGMVVVEKETGAVYLYQDGTLHPMVNYASALLASGHTPPTTASVSRNSLTSVSRGNELGIPNAPNALPDSGKMVRSAWTACTVPGTNEAGNAAVSTVVTAGPPPAGATQLPDGDAVLARTTDGGATYLVFHGYKYQILQPGVVLGPLYGASPAIVAVGRAWLNTLTEGQQIGPITVPQAGKPSAAVAGRHNGDLLEAQLTSGSGDQFYLVFNDGLASISVLQKDIYVGQTGAQPIAIAPREGNEAPKSRLLSPAGGDVQPPVTPPVLFRPASTQDPVCVEANASGRPGVWVGGTLGNPLPGVATTGSTTSGTLLATRVAVPSGKVAVIRVLAAPTAAFGSFQVVTDLGVRYPVVSAAALGTLGYPADKAVDVPPEFANLVPQGPTLDPATVMRPVDTSVGRSGP
jgi:type VII secretion protein EccB